MGFLWGAKDDLPEQGLVCVGKHLAGVTACVAPRLLPALVAANRGAAEDEPVLEAVRELGPLTGPALRDATGATEEGRRPGGALAAQAALPDELPPRGAEQSLGRARP